MIYCANPLCAIWRKTMKRAITIIFCLCLVICAGVLFVACDETDAAQAGEISIKVPVAYSLNESGELIVTYADNSTQNMGKFGQDAINTIETIAVSDDGYYVLNGIKTTIQAIATYTVTFDTGFATKVAAQQVKEGYKVERPQIERAGYTFDGWYCNGEEWSFNANVVMNDMTLTAQWIANQYTVSFINEKGDDPADMVVTYDNNVTLPTVAAAEGYTFSGWYAQSIRYSNGKWATAGDVELTAKWTPNKYAITLNANGGNVSRSTVYVEYGKNFELPVATNDFGVFQGWKCNGQYVTNSEGRSITEWAFLENKEFSCEWIIHIQTAQDLINLSNDENFLNLTRSRIAIVEIDNDIDLAGLDWTPITLNGVEVRGNNHTISNLTSTKGGLFEDVGISNPASTIIKDLKLANVNINVTASTNVVPSSEGIVYVSALARQVFGAVKNVEIISGQITVAQTELWDVIAAGIAVTARDGISDCINRATITSNMLYAYGITMNGNPQNCKNYGDISTGADCMAPFGLASYAYVYGYGTAGVCGQGTISNCHNYGTIHAISSHACGVAVNANATQCSNHGNVISEGSSAAGITIGQILTGDDGMYISDCYNVGNIQANGYAAGISINPIYIYYCYNSGAISGSEKSGGITITSSVARCVNVNSNFASSQSSGANLIQCHVYDGTSTLFKDTLKWSEDIWDFSEEGYPELNVLK